jgi:uncharacterized protein YukJ
MPLVYGFVKGKVAGQARLKGTRRPHETQFHLLVDLDVDSGGGTETWQAAINVGSNNSNDLLKYRMVFDFHHPIRDQLSAAPSGFSDLTGQQALPALDFLRSDILAATGSWRDSDPIDGSDQAEPTPTLTRLLERARQEGAATYVFGHKFVDGVGIHDVHMNQGSTGSLLNNRQDSNKDHNEPWQDGAVIVDLGDDQWAGYFTAFTQQIVPTDELGNPVDGGHPIDNSDPGSLAGR